jgi:DNA-binding LacI/PurR family transcriptional regulator
VPAIPDAGQVARRNIAVWITGEPDDVGAYSVLQGVQAALNPDQFRVFVASPRGRDLQELIRCEAAFLVRLAEDADVAGAILWYLGGEQNRELLEKARQSGKALVFLDRRPPVGMKADFVGIDNRRAARHLVNRLISAGHTRIAHVTNNELACTVADRRQGYEDALQDAGLTYDPKLVRVAAFQKSGEDQYHQFISELMNLPEPPTAVFAVNDYMALCLRAAVDACTVPAARRLLVAGFDDLERWRPGPARLTTVRQPFERIGAASAELLLERLNNPQSDEYTNVIMDAPVIMRDAP